MDILIIGESGYGKSNLGDILKAAIFKSDKESRVVTDDKNRANPTLGNGKNQYNILIRNPEDIDMPPSDITITINNHNFKEWVDEYSY
jgi:ABC-type glutathione transport system ATPase component